jgi:hypothetical protein
MRPEILNYPDGFDILLEMTLCGVAEQGYRELASSQNLWVTWKSQTNY